MAEAQDRTPPEVTVLGGPAPGAPAPSALRRPVLLPLLVALAAVTVLTAAVVGQRRELPPVPECPQPCLERGSVVVGAALPVTGVLAAFGKAQQRGIERALARVNADGGLRVAGQRRTVQLVVRDTRSLPDVAGQEALVLVRGPFRLSGLIGPCTPPVALVRVAESRRVPLVTGCQPLPPVGPSTLHHTWEVAPAERERADAVFLALRGSPSRRAGLFLSNDRAESAWTASAASAGFDVVGTYRPQGANWAPAVAQATEDGVDVVVAVTQPPEGIGLWRELRASALDAELAYASEAGLGSAWQAAVGRSAEGTLTDVVHPSVTGAAGPEQVDEAVATVSSELTQVLLDGLRRAESPQRPDLAAALTGASARVAGSGVRFLGDQASRLPVRLGRWEDGRLVPVVPSGR